MTEKMYKVEYDTSTADGVPAQYVTHMVVQHTDHEFVMTFFSVMPPVVIGSEEQIAKRIEQLELAPAQCAARIVVAASRMPAFVEAVQNNLAHHRSVMAVRTPDVAAESGAAAEVPEDGGDDLDREGL